MATLPEDRSVAIDELESAITELESRLESARAEHDEAKARQVELEIENANLRRELNLAREQQKASAGILSVISSSVADTKPVFESILSSIKHLFDSEESLIFLTSEEGLLQIAAARGANAEAARERFPIPIEGTASELAIRERRLVRSADVQNDPDVPIDLRETARRIGQNYSMAIAPMLWEDKAIGTVFVGRTSMVPFTDRECELLNSFADQAVIAIQNARLFGETREALERQTATADILKVIASSPSEVQPVLDVIVNSAAELFAPHTAVITTLQDGKLHWRAIAASGPSFDHEKAKSIYPIPFDPDRSPSCRAIMERRIIEIPDVEAPGTPELTRWVAAAGGFRSATFVPLIHRGEGVGTINLTTPQAGFRLSEKQLTLVKTFADQAVIAIENTRLFNETREALERQTATAEILKVIASSPSDVQPVFEAIASSAKTLLGAFSTTVLRFMGDELHLVAYTPTDPKADEALQSSFPRPLAEFPTFALVRNGETIQFPDTEADDVPPANKELGRLRGFRSVLFTPLMNQGTPVGIISVTRAEPGAFAPHHVQLLQTFADQAVIAIENTRLFNETKEALERQTATAEILKVIASSPSDVQPVFDAIAHSANRLIGGFSAAVFRYSDGRIHLAAFTPTDAQGDAVLQSSFPVPLAEFPPYQLTRDGAPVELPDTDLEPAARDIARARGYRSMLFAPLMNDGAAIGIITVTRVAPGPFAEQHTRLLQMFADQAVIAIRNVGLFNEVQARTEDLSESLRQQTAVGDVLKTISRSTFELQPVLDALVNSAAHLCDADMAFIMRRVGDEYRAGAAVGYTEAYIDFLTNHPLAVDRGTVTGRAVLDKRPVQIADVMADPEYTLSTLAGQRTVLGVPLLREDEPIGVIVLARQHVEPFTEKQIDLVATFADQAVIAIENVRLFNEVQQRTEDLSEALQQQTATADVLKVISRSAFDLETVLNTLTESAARLCNADMAAVTRQHPDGGYHHATRYNFPPEWDRFVQSTRLYPGRGSLVGRVLLEGKAVQIPDVLADPEYAFPEQQRAGGYRTLLGVPLLREGQPIGVLFLGRTTVEPFSDKQIELVQTFADQAIIAIENVRLFDEVQARTRELSEALTYQTGSANILKVIASSPTDITPVLNAIVESACALCDAYDAVLRLKEGDNLCFSAHHGPISTFMNERPINRGWTAGRAVIDQRPIQINDLLSSEGDEFLEARELALQQGHRTVLSVPLLREGESLGAITLRRQEVNPFSDKQIALLQTFADQAVIAIGNVRLFEEVQAKSRDLTEALTYQTGSANILKVIASSPTDVGPVLDAIVESACELCDANDAIVYLKEDEHLSYKAHHGPIPVIFGEKRAINRDYVAGRSVVDKMPIHVSDVFSEDGAEFPEARELSRSEGIRSILSAPLLHENESIGAILLRRTEVHPFTDKQINLLQTFADQAVIAIGNVQLFEEVQARTRDLTEALQQQTATAEVLRVISASPGELEPVFQAMLENAVRLCEAKFAMLRLLEGDQFRAVGMWNLPPDYREFLAQNPIRINAKIPLGRLVNSKQPVHVHDVLQDESYLERYPGMIALAEIGGARTLLQVPMLKEGQLVGSIGIYRQEVRPFTDKQIALVQNFASQAVIAIENARLLNELRQRTSELSKSLDDLRTAQDRLVQTEKLASLGQLTAGIAHEIKNPLNFVNNFAALSAELTEELNDVLKPAEIAEKVRAEVDELTGLLKDNLERVVQHGKRADSIVKNMLLHSREGGGEHRLSDINALVDESLNLAYHGARAEKPGFNVTLERDFDPAAGQIDVLPQEITRVFLNLVSNGFYAVTKRRKEGGEPGFEPTLRASTRNLGDAVEIRIRDNGIGIPPEVKEKMFNPFFTTKPAGEGTGLGLSMSHDIIVKQHSGTIDVDTEQGHFTEFRIVLPRTSNFAEKSRGEP